MQAPHTEHLLDATAACAAGAVLPVRLHPVPFAEAGCLLLCAWQCLDVKPADVADKLSASLNDACTQGTTSIISAHNII